MVNLLDEKLQCILESVAEEFKGVMGISVMDLVSGEEFYVNEDEVFPVGCAIKIPVLIELFRKARAERVDLDGVVTVYEGDKARGSGVLKELGDGTVSITLRDIATLMIIVSDNTAMNLLIDVTEMAEVNDMIMSLGLKETKLQRKMMDYIAASKGLENLSTPRDFMRMMEYLYRQKRLNPEKSVLVVDKLGGPWQGNTFKCAGIFLNLVTTVLNFGLCDSTIDWFYHL